MMPSLVRKYIKSLIPRFLPHSFDFPPPAVLFVASSPPALHALLESGIGREEEGLVEIQRSRCGGAFPAACGESERCRGVARERREGIRIRSRNVETKEGHSKTRKPSCVLFLLFCQRVETVLISVS